MASAKSPTRYVRAISTRPASSARRVRLIAFATLLHDNGSRALSTEMPSAGISSQASDFPPKSSLVCTKPLSTELVPTGFDSRRLHNDFNYLGTKMGFVAHLSPSWRGLAAEAIEQLHRLAGDVRTEMRVAGRHFHGGVAEQLLDYLHRRAAHDEV